LVKQKTRDWLGNRGFFEILCWFALENPSHDANRPGDAMPNAHHLAPATHGAQIGFKGGVHFATFTCRDIFSPSGGNCQTVNLTQRWIEREDRSSVARVISGA
jgi:hypothetical protein